MEKLDSARIAVIEEIVTRMDHRLFGNGQPGELSSMKTRITKLENWRWWLIGIGVGIGAGSGAAGLKLIQMIGK